MKLIPESTWWRRLMPLAAGFLVVGLLVLTVVTKPKFKDAPATTSAPTGKTKATPPSSHQATLEEDTKAEQEEPNLSPVEKFVRGESEKVGKADPDPNKSFQRLKNVARSLKRKDIEALKRTALNSEYNNDRRFLSAYILTLAEDAAVAPALMSIALDPLTVQDVSSRLYAEELMLRTQALQGLAKYQPSQGRGPLENYLEKQDNAFLSDQARRLINERSKRR